MFALIQEVKWIYKKFRLSYILPIVVLVSYTFIGAVIFRHFELEPDETLRQRYRESTEYAFNQVLKRMLEIQCERKNGSVYLQQIQIRDTKEALFWLIDYLNLTQIIEERCESSPWTWIGSLFYAGQLYTTIGYGLPAAQTAGGRLSSIIYIMIGIPIFLIILKEVGKILSRTLRKLYKRMRTAKEILPEGARRMSEPVKAIYQLSINPLGLGTTLDNDLERNEKPQGILKRPNEEKEPEKAKAKKSGEFPIPLALIILVVWILFSAALFCLWELEWGYLTSVYFFFVSISTVGLGDVVPTKPDMMLVNFILILIGLALLSMCIDLIQCALERFINQLLDEYIEEIEKMAAIVTSADDFVEEEAKPFEVGMTEMLTVPLKTITEQKKQSNIIRSAKDWVAERIATNVLVSRLDPYQSSSDSEEELEENERKSSRGSRMMSENREDNISLTSTATHRKIKNKFGHRGGFLQQYNMPTMRAIRAIETVKMRTDLNSSFRSRLFAKFATNDRLARLVEEHTPPPPPAQPSKMVSFSVQTSPIPEREQKPKRPPLGMGLGSMDSFSSNSRKNGAESSTKSFDMDSLYSSTYFDLAFAGYHTDSVSHLQNSALLEDEEPAPALPSPPPALLLPPSPAAHNRLGPPSKVQRRFSTTGCLPAPLPLEQQDSPFEGKMSKCPSCSGMNTSSGDSATLQRVHRLCGIMPSDFVQHSLPLPNHFQNGNDSFRIPQFVPKPSANQQPSRT